MKVGDGEIAARRPGRNEKHILQRETQNANVTEGRAGREAGGCLRTKQDAQEE